MVGSITLAGPLVRSALMPDKTSAQAAAAPCDARPAALAASPCTFTPRSQSRSLTLDRPLVQSALEAHSRCGQPRRHAPHRSCADEDGGAGLGTPHLAEGAACQLPCACQPSTRHQPDVGAAKAVSGLTGPVHSHSGRERSAKPRARLVSWPCSCACWARQAGVCPGRAQPGGLGVPPAAWDRLPARVVLPQHKTGRGPAQGAPALATLRMLNPRAC